MDWIPIVFVIFKFLVLGTGMFFAIKWHYDQGRKGKAQEARAVLRTSAKVAVVFVLAVVVLGVVTLDLARLLGMDLNLS